MQRFHLFIPGEQLERFRDLAERTGLPVADWMRRLFDHGLSSAVLNELMPRMSGQMETR